MNSQGDLIGGKSPIRIQRKRTKGWRMPENTVYVGRGSRFGNPYRVGDDNEVGHLTQQEAVDAFENLVHWVNEGGTTTDEHDCLLFENIVRELRGKNLACWCKENEPCHADILLAMANEEE